MLNGLANPNQHKKSLENEMNTLNDYWESFQKMVIRPDAPPEQLREMKKAFYAGAHAYGIMIEKFVESSNSENGEIDVSPKMFALASEVRDFLDKIANVKQTIH